MTAQVTKAATPRRFLAWCDECQDGHRGVKVTASNWAYQHNVKYHEGEQP